MRSFGGMVGGGSCVADGIMASKSSTSSGELGSLPDDEEKEGALAGAGLRRGVADFATFDARRGGLKDVGLRFDAELKYPDGMALGFVEV